MIIAITGTPATGKSSVGAELSRLTGYEAVGLNELAEKEDLYKGHDKERGCKIVDVDSLSEVVGSMDGKGSFIIESHYAQEMPADLTVVLRTSPRELRKRMEEKGWGKKKIEENMLSETMEVCKQEAFERKRVIAEVDTTGKEPSEAAEEIASAMQKEGLFISKDAKIPESLKEELRKPFGKVFMNIEEALGSIKGRDVISVGDLASYSLVEAGVKPGIIVVDGKVMRKPFDKEIKLDSRVMRSRNPQGYVTSDLWSDVQRSLDDGESVRIQVEGEEDMATLFYMLLAPDTSVIFYGLFTEGIVAVEPGPKRRKDARRIMKEIASAQYN